MAPKQRIQVAAEMCRDCQTCTLACSLHYEGECNLGLARLVVTKDMARYQFNILICQHCDEPDCLPACPSDAMILDERGIVLMLDDQCDCCGMCASSCPYDAIFHSAAHNRYLKCDLCAGRKEGPLCVELCPVGALTLIEVAAIAEEV
jgi:carbon-monoxide dehydrogenase iron sulfur subunit